MPRDPQGSRSGTFAGKWMLLLIAVFGVIAIVLLATSMGKTGHAANDQPQTGRPPATGS